MRCDHAGRPWGNASPVTLADGRGPPAGAGGLCESKAEDAEQGDPQAGEATSVRALRRDATVQPCPMLRIPNA